ncbi:MAG: hypothetical protein ABIE42_04785, partial [Candidatus Eisenbacteria bacterium]
MTRAALLVLAVCVLAGLAVPSHAADAPFDLLSVMREELDRSLTNFADASEAPMYYLQYSVTDMHEYSLAVTNGGLNAPESYDHRYLDVDLRVGGMELDNTHEIRSGNWRDNYTPTRHIDFPMDDNAGAVRAALWNETEFQFMKAQERLTKVESNRQVKVEEEDLSNDFSPGEAHTYSEPTRRTEVDEEYWSATMPSNLPDEATFRENAERIISELAALRDAPVVEPYIGPAILMNRDSGVFFHEIFGHRIEGHRQKSESEGQTFTKKV